MDIDELGPDPLYCPACNRALTRVWNAEKTKVINFHCEWCNPTVPISNEVNVKEGI